MVDIKKKKKGESIERQETRGKYNSRSWKKAFCLSRCASFSITVLSNLIFSLVLALPVLYCAYLRPVRFGPLVLCHPPSNAHPWSIWHLVWLSLTISIPLEIDQDLDVFSTQLDSSPHNRKGDDSPCRRTHSRLRLYRVLFAPPSNVIRTIITTVTRYRRNPATS